VSDSDAGFDQFPRQVADAAVFMRREFEQVRRLCGCAANGGVQVESSMCPHCRTSLPPVRDAFCPFCRGALGDPAASPPERAEPPDPDRPRLTLRQRAILQAYRDFRDTPPSTARLLARAAPVELLRGGLLVGLAGVLYLIGLPLVAAAVAGVAVGAFLRDLGQFMDSVEVWPAVCAVTDWSGVDAVLDGDDQ
jgi:hypothetical protein